MGGRKLNLGEWVEVRFVGRIEGISQSAFSDAIDVSVRPFPNGEKGRLQNVTAEHVIRVKDKENAHN